MQIFALCQTSKQTFGHLLPNSPIYFFWIQFIPFYTHYISSEELKKSRKNKLDNGRNDGTKWRVQKTHTHAHIRTDDGMHQWLYVCIFCSWKVNVAKKSPHTECAFNLFIFPSQMIRPYINLHISHCVCALNYASCVYVYIRTVSIYSHTNA